MNDIKYGRKKSGIKKELSEKIGAWISSIDDEEVRDACAKDTIVTGGSIASMLLGEPINDFDIYFRTHKTTLMVAHYYVNKFNGVKSGLQLPFNQEHYHPQVVEKELVNCKGNLEHRIGIYTRSDGVAEDVNLTQPEAKEGKLPSADDTNNTFLPAFLSENAITLTDKIQLVIRFYGEPDIIHDNYDFEHAKCYWDHGKKDLVLPASALECLLSRTLIYRGSLYPIASIFRTKKFIERGWRISAGQQLKIMWQISELDLKDPVVIREQLTGVDQAYLSDLITQLEKMSMEGVDSTVVAQIIDRIFD